MKMRNSSDFVCVVCSCAQFEQFRYFCGHDTLDECQRCLSKNLCAIESRAGKFDMVRYTIVHLWAPIQIERNLGMGVN